MAIFGKDAGSKDAPRPAPDPKASPSKGSSAKGQQQGEGALSIIAAGMRIIGDVESDGVVKVEGKVEGAVRAARQVLVGRQGEVHGDIYTGEAVIGGRVQGKIVAERIEVQGTSIVVGDIETVAITVAEGGKINGSVRISDTIHSDSSRKGKGKDYITPLSVAAVS